MPNYELVFSDHPVKETDLRIRIVFFFLTSTLQLATTATPNVVRTSQKSSKSEKQTRRTRAIPPDVPVYPRRADSICISITRRPEVDELSLVSPGIR